MSPYVNLFSSLIKDKSTYNINYVKIEHIKKISLIAYYNIIEDMLDYLVFIIYFCTRIVKCF